ARSKTTPPASSMPGRQGLALRELAQSINANPAMRGTLAAQIRWLPQWALPETGPARGPVTAAGGEARRQEMEWLALALAADPERRRELQGLLTEDEDRALAAQLEAMTALQIGFLRKAIDLADERQVQALGVRLSSLFASPDAAVPPAAAPVADLESRAALEEYLAQPGRARVGMKTYRTEEGETTRRFRTALFESGRYRPSCDQTLRQLGYDAVAIQSPRATELAQLGESDGFFLRSERLHWATAATSIESYVQSLPSTSLRTGFRHKLKQSKDCPADLGPMTEARYEAWREILVKEVVSRPGGFEVYGKGFVQGRAQDGELDLWRTLLFRSPDDAGKVIGGALLYDNVRYGGMLTIAGAAYDAAFRKLHLPIRTMATAMEIAASSALPIVSHGADVNFFGFMLSVGLMGYKASLALTPYAHGPFELFKMLTFGPFEAERSDFLFFSVKRGSDLERRYIEAVERGDVPIGRRLSGGRPGSPQALDAAHNLEVQHFHFGDGGTGAAKPHGVRVVKYRIADAASGELIRET
ncbi:MAG TPA: hypothetical protein VLT33_30465, partial [Labilithrix sp.]|nr:hypothetical protein [Labilithrix sp.]